jgi:hypothetical protein
MVVTNVAYGLIVSDMIVTTVLLYEKVSDTFVTNDVL